jgi:peptidoglycan/LPS O-acetylase OafA/YrhL
MVFAGHLTLEMEGSAGIAFPRWNGVGAAGVDLFFVISGFVMVYASVDLFGRPHTRWQFAQQRLTRIVPLYWLISGVLLIHALLRYDAAGLLRADLSPQVLAASFFFIPIPRPDGDLGPLLRGGWTLEYEMFFYLLFAVCLSLPKRAAVAATAGLLIAVIAIAIPFSRWPAPVAIEFIYGMVIALIAAEAKCSRFTARVLIVGGVAGLAATSEVSSLSAFRFAAWGIPSALIVAGATLYPFGLKGRLWAPLLILGNASYALYLVHPFMIAPRLIAERLFGASTGLWLRSPIIYAALMVALVIPAALALHFWVEKPLLAWLRRPQRLAEAVIRSPAE